MHIASPFLGLSDKAARQANRKCDLRWSVLFSTFIFCSTKWALVTISGPYEQCTWLRRLTFEGLGALRQLWISIGSFVKQKVKCIFEMMRLPGLLQCLMRLPGSLNQLFHLRQSCGYSHPPDESPFLVKEGPKRAAAIRAQGG